MVVTAVIVCATMRTKRNCDNAKQEHTYYKVSGDWAMSHFEIQFCDMVQECNFMMSLPDAVISNVQPFKLLLLHT